jgi:hypothetical protein
MAPQSFCGVTKLERPTAAARSRESGGYCREAWVAWPAPAPAGAFADEGNGFIRAELIRKPARDPCYQARARAKWYPLDEPVV